MGQEERFSRLIELKTEPSEAFRCCKSLRYNAVACSRSGQLWSRSPTELARQLDVPANRITQIVNGKRGITGDSALRLAHWFGNKPQFWMSLQARYDLELAEAELGQTIRALPTGPRGRRHKTNKHEQIA